jgi:hypothetical protein
MGFWEDASPVVKGAIVFGGVGILYLAIAFFAGLPPYGGGEEAAATRGLPPAGATAHAVPRLLRCRK